MFCSNASTGKGHCTGDQGGPLVCKDDVTNEAIVAGVISWSEDCGTDSPRVYSRVTHVLDWIQDYLVILPFYGVCPFFVKPSLSITALLKSVHFKIELHDLQNSHFQYNNVVFFFYALESLIKNLQWPA